ncbi:flagellar biosynthetic protein FliO [Massilia antarctica]|uniref:flagellar biosynthetic protein FliO n=1 Tax=Massilia antarctica TaxID=2765360 RepID=UPI0006BCDDD8|nr:flagellar biosynthetic protein FliO [Massilia sp. H27-R4]MCY0911396.1 flagellar biosynthetic protein FliO [Massilia sp. H27-R4]CUI05002.1 Flagellar biosynthesis protein FliQ [Janthinobacterium sp. CG23_2]CUU28788.1 Flagellar biosynthesis protein FliQ [Janthinobacterium sp. CG23_2]
MTARLLAAAALACSLAPALAADPVAASVPAAAATSASVPAASVPASPVALASAPAAAAAQAGSVQAAPAATLPAPAAAQAAPGPMTGPSAGNLLQTIFALTLVLALLGGMVWFMKRYGPQSAAGAAQIRTVGALSLGGRERIIVVEVGDQWIVVGASPGRVNALATMPKRDAPPGGPALLVDGPASGSFAEWLKQTIDKRNGR